MDPDAMNSGDKVYEESNGGQDEEPQIRSVPFDQNAGDSSFCSTINSYNGSYLGSPQEDQLTPRPNELDESNLAQMSSTIDSLDHSSLITEISLDEANIDVEKKNEDVSCSGKGDMAKFEFMSSTPMSKEHRTKCPSQESIQGASNKNVDSDNNDSKEHELESESIECHSSDENGHNFSGQSWISRSVMVSFPRGLTTDDLLNCFKTELNVISLALIDQGTGGQHLKQCSAIVTFSNDTEAKIAVSTNVLLANLNMEVVPVTSELAQNALTNLQLEEEFEGVTINKGDSSLAIAVPENGVAGNGEVQIVPIKSEVSHGSVMSLEVEEEREAIANANDKNEAVTNDALHGKDVDAEAGQDLEQQILLLVLKASTTDQTKDLVGEILFQLKDIMRDQLGDLHTKLYLVGSYATGTALKTSDVNLVLLWEPNEALSTDKSMAQRLLFILQSSDAISKAVMVIEHDKEAHIRFIAKAASDLSFGLRCTRQGASIVHVELMKKLMEIDWKMEPILIFLKIWARFFKICGPNEGNISSHALETMAIFYLQTQKVLPPIKLFMEQCPSYKALRDGFSDYGQVEKLTLELADASSPSRKCNKEGSANIVDIIFGFFRYLYVLESSHVVLSPYTGMRIPERVIKAQDFHKHYLEALSAMKKEALSSLDTKSELCVQDSLNHTMKDECLRNTSLAPLFSSKHRRNDDDDDGNDGDAYQTLNLVTSVTTISSKTVSREDRKSSSPNHDEASDMVNNGQSETACSAFRAQENTAEIEEETRDTEVFKENEPMKNNNFSGRGSKDKIEPSESKEQDLTIKNEKPKDETQKSRDCGDKENDLEETNAKCYWNKEPADNSINNIGKGSQMKLADSRNNNEKQDFFGRNRWQAVTLNAEASDSDAPTLKVKPFQFFQKQVRQETNSGATNGPSTFTGSFLNSSLPSRRVETSNFLPQGSEGLPTSLSRVGESQGPNPQQPKCNEDVTFTTVHIDLAPLMGRTNKDLFSLALSSVEFVLDKCLLTTASIFESGRTPLFAPYPTKMECFEEWANMEVVLIADVWTDRQQFQRWAISTGCTLLEAEIRASQLMAKSRHRLHRPIYFKCRLCRALTSSKVAITLYSFSEYNPHLMSFLSCTVKNMIEALLFGPQRFESFLPPFFSQNRLSH